MVALLVFTIKSSPVYHSMTFMWNQFDVPVFIKIWIKKKYQNNFFVFWLYLKSIIKPIALRSHLPIWFFIEHVKIPAYDRISLLQGMTSRVIGSMKENVSQDSLSLIFCPSGLLTIALKQREWILDWINFQIPHSFYLLGQLKEVSSEETKIYFTLT